MLQWLLHLKKVVCVCDPYFYHCSPYRTFCEFQKYESNAREHHCCFHYALPHAYRDGGGKSQKSWKKLQIDSGHHLYLLQNF